MENDSDFQEDYSNELNQGLDNTLEKRSSDPYSISYNDDFEIKREKLRQTELRDHPERFRLLAHSLTQFVPIKKNKYLERKRYVLSEKEASSLICTCQKATIKKNEKFNSHQSYNCGESCINRCVSTECCLQTCPCGQFCKNRRFQLHQNAYVFPAKTEKKGWGLFAGEYIPKGTFIMQYVGEVFAVDSELGQQRVQKYKNSTCTYLMSTSNNEVIDPTYVGNIARFINHSCDPNCQTQKWNVLGEVCVGIFAVKDIQENEELSFDYQFDFYKTPFTKCYCGTQKCKGYLGVLATTDDNKLDSLSAPMCPYCPKAITERNDLILCRGPCKQTFHLNCLATHEGKKVASLLQVYRKNYICKTCYLKLNGQKKRGRKSQKELDEIQRLQEQDLLGLGGGNSENPQEDREINILPWESKDPNIKKYFIPSEENKLLDKIIAREVEQIERDMEKNQKKKRKGQFSEFYNFISELTKRLKIRIKENKKNYKFRKNRTQKLENTKVVKRRGRPKRDQTDEASKQYSQSQDQISSISRSQQESENESEQEDPSSQVQDEEMDEEREESKDEIEESSLEGSNEQVDQAMEESDDEDEDAIDEEDEIDEEQQQIDKALDFENLQNQEEEEKSGNHLKIDNLTVQEEKKEDENMHKRRLHRLISQEKEEDFDILKKTPIKHSPRKNSLLYQSQDQQQRDKASIQQLIKQKMDAFALEQKILYEQKLGGELEVKESKINISEGVFNMIILEHIDDLACISHLQIFWESPWGGFVTVRLLSTFKQYTFLTTMFQEVTDLLHKSNSISPKQELINSGEFQISQKSILPFDIVTMIVPKNFLRKLVGYQDKVLNDYRKKYQVDFDYNRDLLVDEVFQMNETTTIRIFGKSQDVYITNELLQKELEVIKIKTLVLQMVDCKLIMDNVKEMKVLVDPCEIRVKRIVREWKDLRHPFYYIPNYFREVALIGTQSEIDYAEKQIEKFYQDKRETSTTQQLSFLLPIFFKGMMADIKNDYARRFPQIQIFYYEPTYPRKHLTLLIVGVWSQIVLVKASLEEEINRYMLKQGGYSFEGFQQFTYHQQIRFCFKSLKRFILESDIKFLNHWDICSLFVENAGKPQLQEEEKQKQECTLKRTFSLLDQLVQDTQQDQQNENKEQEIKPVLDSPMNDQQVLQQKDSDFRALVQFIKYQDVETCINSLFVLANSEDSLESLMKRLTITKKDLIQMLGNVLAQNIKEYQDNLIPYQYYHNNRPQYEEQKQDPAQQQIPLLPLIPPAEVQIQSGRSHSSSRSSSHSVHYSRNRYSRDYHRPSHKRSHHYSKKRDSSSRDKYSSSSRSHSRGRRRSSSSSRSYSSKKSTPEKRNYIQRSSRFDYSRQYQGNNNSYEFIGRSSYQGTFYPSSQQQYSTHVNAFSSTPYQQASYPSPSHHHRHSHYENRNDHRRHHRHHYSRKSRDSSESSYRRHKSSRRHYHGRRKSRSRSSSHESYYRTNRRRHSPLTIDEGSRRRTYHDEHPYFQAQRYSSYRDRRDQNYYHHSTSGHYERHRYRGGFDYSRPRNEYHLSEVPQSQQQQYQQQGKILQSTQHEEGQIN